MLNTYWTLLKPGWVRLWIIRLFNNTIMRIVREYGSKTVGGGNLLFIFSYDKFSDVTYNFILLFIDCIISIPIHDFNRLLFLFYSKFIINLYSVKYNSWKFSRKSFIRVEYVSVCFRSRIFTTMHSFLLPGSCFHNIFRRHSCFFFCFSIIQLIRHHLMDHHRAIYLTTIFKIKELIL